MISSDLGPQYLSEYLSHETSTHPTHSSQSLMSKTMTPNEAKRASTKNCNFSFVPPIGSSIEDEIIKMINKQTNKQKFA